MASKKNVPDTQAGKEVELMAAEEKKITNIEEEEIKQLFVRDEYGRRYTLEFSPNVVKTMERSGFKIDMEYPMTCAEDLFAGAFQMHHGGKITRKFILKIWEAQTKKPDLLAALVKLYMNPVKEFMKEPEGADENADPTWEAI